MGGEQQAAEGDGVGVHFWFWNLILVVYTPMILAETLTINLADLIAPLIPIIMVGVLLIFVRPLFKGQNAHMGFMREHSERVEAQLRQIIDLLERRDRGG